eukprot:38337-Chlamydomonas_euryale.AAC.13
MHARLSPTDCAAALADDRAVQGALLVPGAHRGADAQAPLPHQPRPRRPLARGRDPARRMRRRLAAGLPVGVLPAAAARARLSRARAFPWAYARVAGVVVLCRAVAWVATRPL